MTKDTRTGKEEIERFLEKPQTFSQKKIKLLEDQKITIRTSKYRQYETSIPPTRNEVVEKLNELIDRFNEKEDEKAH